MDKNLRLSLLSGASIKVKNIGRIHPLTLREIGEIGEDKYNQYLSLLTLDKEVLEEREDINLDKINSLDILAGNSHYDRNFRRNIEEGLSIFFKEEVAFIEDYFIFHVGKIEEERFIHRENFNEIVKILKLQNNIRDRVKTNIKTSKKAQLLSKKRDMGRKLISPARGENSITLSDLISVMGVFTKNLSTVLDMTIFQLYDQYERFIKRENYKSSFDMYLVGVDPKKLSLDKHWTLT